LLSSQVLAAWDQLRHIHKDPRVVGLWRACFDPVLRWLNPGRRRLLLGFGALVVAVRQPVRMLRENVSIGDSVMDHAIMLQVAGLMFVFAASCYLLATRFGSLPAVMRRHPLIALHAAFWALLALVWTTRPAPSTVLPVLAGCALVMPFLIWRLGYLLLTAQRGNMTGTRPQDHALYLWPLWGGTNTPYGKGFDYLKSTEARDEEALARSQLAGLKLIVLAVVFHMAARAMEGLVFGVENGYRRAAGGLTLGLPMVEAWLSAQPGTHSALKGWLALYCDLFLQVLKLAASGHMIIGYLRLFGFNVFRNTYKPLLAETISEFWNRYYYYFKELLVHFFFFPTFVRYFKRSPRLRLFTAVLASAFLGNIYYHVIQDDSLVRGDWEELARMQGPRASYCFLLALGIYLSMRREQRQQGPRPARTWPRRAVAIFGVWTFFAFIRVFAYPDPPLGDRFNAILGLSGIGMH
jgi:hypothetical protein